MPKLSDSMEQGTILTWLRQDGEHIEAGEDLVEIETDKATMTHAVDASGVLSIIAAEGATLPVGAPIACLGDIAVASRPKSDARQMSESPIGSSGVVIPKAAAPVGNGTHDRADAVKATPLARRVAGAQGIALEDVSGTGPAGRVTRADVLIRAGLAPEPSPLSALPVTTAHPPSATEPASAGSVAPDPSTTAGMKGTVKIVELTGLQGVVACRMAETKATVPEFQVQADVVMDAAIAFRGQIKAAGANAPSFNDLIIKAAALALRAHPRANGTYREGHFELYSRVNVGIVVAAEDSLIVPTVFDTDEKSLGTIAGEARRLASRVREGIITPPELSGATFTVSNLGMYGMTVITPVINSPQAAILGVGTMRPHLARVNGEIVKRQLMTLTLSCDHRILYGADAAQFLSEIRTQLEQPLRLAL